MKPWSLCYCGVLSFLMPVAATMPNATADETVKVKQDAAKSDAVKSDAVKSDAVKSDAVKQDEFTHPLAWTIRYAKSRKNYIRENIRDYTCRLIKRERIDGELQEYQFIQAQVRCEQQRDGRVVQPLSVFMQYLGPARLKDRRVLFIEGENSGKILVRKGGSALKYLRLSIDPNSVAARRESNYPITDVGFDKIIDRLIERVSDDIENDPTAANTEVSHFAKAKVNERYCTHIRVVHPKQGDGIKFHQASLYVDDEFHVPVRLVVYGWPEEEGKDPPLVEEYTYVDLRLNVGLTDDIFSEQRLDSSSSRPTVATTSLAQ